MVLNHRFLSYGQVSGQHRLRHSKTAYENSILFNAKKTVKLIVYPTANPIVWAVDAYDRFGGDNRVNAHPSTAISTEENKRGISGSYSMPWTATEA